MNIIILTGHKLRQLDAVIPFAMEIKTHFPEAKTTFVLADKENFDFLEKNYHLVKAIKSINGKIVYPPREKIWAFCIWMIFFALKMVFKKNYVFKSADYFLKHKLFMKFIKKISATKEILFNLSVPAKTFTESETIQKAFIAESTGQEQCEENLDFSGDFLISSRDLSGFEKLYGTVPEPEKFINIGYTRAFERWSNFILKEAELVDKQNEIPYILFILTTTGKRLSFADEPPIENLLRESLEALNKIDEEFIIYFRPHSVTDLNLVRNILAEIGIKNYKIDYGHPSVLMMKSKCVMANMFSNTMLDAYYYGVPVVEYSYYDPKLAKSLNNRSFGGDCCDHFISSPNSEFLQNTVKKLIKSNTEFDVRIINSEGLYGNFEAAKAVFD